MTIIIMRRYVSVKNMWLNEKGKEKNEFREKGY